MDGWTPVNRGRGRGRGRGYGRSDNPRNDNLGRGRGDGQYDNRSRGDGTPGRNPGTSFRFSQPLRGTSNPSANAPGPVYPSSSSSLRGQDRGKAPADQARGDTLPEGALVCNHFAVKFAPKTNCFYQYNVEVCRWVVPRGGGNGKAHEVLGKEKRLTLMGVLLTFLKENEKIEFIYNGDKELYSTSQLTPGDKIRLESLEHSTTTATSIGESGGVDRRRQERTNEASGSSENIVFVVNRDYNVTITVPPTPIDLGGFPHPRDINADPARDGNLNILKALSIYLINYAKNVQGNIRAIHHNFFQTDRSMSLGNGVNANVKIWKGFHATFGLTYATSASDRPRLMLTFNNVQTAVLADISVEDFIRNILGYRCNLRRMPQPDLAKVNAALRGVRVQTTYLPKRTYVVQGLDTESSISRTFTKGGPNPANISVARYYDTELRQPLEHSDWQLLHMRSTRDGPQVYIPIEKCKILEGQRTKRLSAEQTRKFLEQCQLGPIDRKKKIEDLLNEFLRPRRDGDDLKKAGIEEIQTEMNTVRSRQLSAYQAVWGKKCDPLKNTEWVVYVFRNNLFRGNSETFYNLERQLREKFNEQGALPALVLFENGEVVQDPSRRIEQMLRHIRTRIRDVKLIVAVLPEKSSDLYVPLKRQCTIVRGHQDRRHEFQRGVMTQCVVFPRGGFKDAYCNNVALKITLKLGGSNTNLSPGDITQSDKTCIFGIDVSHGSTGDTGSPSIAAVVASVESNQWSRYAAQVRAQKANQECMFSHTNELKWMVVELLKEFQKNHSGVLPSRIVAYRDGVSESQLKKVETAEIGQFRDACAEIDPLNGSRVKITFIIVQKRHHTRFFKKQGGGFTNMAQGTVVSSESGVCQTKDRDFYLCSHYGVIGTSRPAHYTVLWDENYKFNLNTIQDLSNKLCYCFGRTTKAVSIPAPVYYAHVAAKHYLNFETEVGPTGDPQMAGQLREMMTETEHSMYYV